jgi:hypothetical protein
MTREQELANALVCVVTRMYTRKQSAWLSPANLRAYAKALRMQGREERSELREHLRFCGVLEKEQQDRLDARLRGLRWRKIRGG